MIDKGLDLLKEGLEQDSKKGTNNFIILIFGILSLFMLGGFNFLNQEIQKTQALLKEELAEIKTKVERNNSLISSLERYKAVLEDRDKRK